jgi:translation initiation factor 1
MTDISTLIFNTQNIDIDDDLHEDSREIHIRIRKRNGKKCVTTMENLDVIDDDLSVWKSLFKHFKQTFCCNGCINKEEKVIMLFGDQREKIKNYLIDKESIKKELIKVHGF